MLLIQSALESPLPCRNTTGGGPVSAAGGRLGGAACGWRGGPCCWASTSKGHSAAAPDSSARRPSIDRLISSPPDIGPHVGKARRPALRLPHVPLLRRHAGGPSGPGSGSRRRDK